MITVRLHENGPRVILHADDIAWRVVAAVASEHAEDPYGVAAGLDEITRRRRCFEGLANLVEARDLPEHLVTGAAAALDAALQAFVDVLAEPIHLELTEAEARRLAVDLTRHAARAAAARYQKGNTP